MSIDFGEEAWFTGLTDNDRELVERLKAAQLVQNQTSNATNSPLISTENVSDLIDKLKERVQQDPDYYGGIYFTDDGQAFVVGIIDTLTGWDLSKKSANVFKSIRYLNDQTPEGYPAISTVPPNVYADRFRSFITSKIHEVKEQNNENAINQSIHEADLVFEEKKES